jgi:hypothetical protein
MLAEVARVGRRQPCDEARNAEAADVPIDFRCYALSTATHTLATVVDGNEGLLEAQSEEAGGCGWMRIVNAWMRICAWMELHGHGPRSRGAWRIRQQQHCAADMDGRHS